MDTISGNLRLTYDRPELLRGISFLVAVIGLFGIGEILVTMEEDLAFKGLDSKLNLKVVFQTWKKLPRYWLTMVRSMAIGWWMGVTPGGPTAASFMSYGIAKKFSRNPERFGSGEMEGVIAPETADHAAGTSALLPMLALGIPGSATAAVMLGGLMIWGLRPGPMLFVEQKDFVWGLIASMYMGNVVSLIVVLATVPLFAAILRIPFSIIAPVIIVVCAIGAYTVNSSVTDVGLMLGFGVLGYFFKKLRLSRRADGAGHGARRPGGGGVPPVAAAVARQSVHLLELADLGHAAVAVGVADRAAAAVATARAACVLEPRGSPCKLRARNPSSRSTLGDPAGIGAELIARLLARPRDRRRPPTSCWSATPGCGQTARRSPARRVRLDPVRLAGRGARPRRHRARRLPGRRHRAARRRCTAARPRPPAAPRCWRC